MFVIDRHGIKITRGDTARFVIALEGRDVAEGTKALFTVKAPPWEPCRPDIEKLIDVEEGKVQVLLESEDTDITPGNYVWDVRLFEPEDEAHTNVVTPMEYAAFKVLEAIGDE